MRRPTVSALRCVTNQGGMGSSVRSPFASVRGNGANGARTTVFSGRSKRNVLWTQPIPLPAFANVLPGNAPQLAVGSRKPTPGQVLIVTEPYRNAAIASSNAGPSAAIVRRVNEHARAERTVQDVVAECDGVAQKCRGVVAGKRRLREDLAERFLREERFVVIRRVEPGDERARVAAVRPGERFCAGVRTCAFRLTRLRAGVVRRARRGAAQRVAHGVE